VTKARNDDVSVVKIGMTQQLNIEDDDA